MNFYKILSTNIIYLLSDLFVFIAMRHRKYDAFMKNIFEPKYKVVINLIQGKFRIIEHSSTNRHTDTDQN